MSKTVIVFSTYFITPNFEYAFCKESVKEKLFEDAGIKDFFWERLKRDSFYVNHDLVKCVDKLGAFPSTQSSSKSFSKDDIVSFIKERLRRTICRGNFR